MKNPWRLKMEQFTSFSAAEIATLDHLITDRTDRHKKGEDIIVEGAHSPDCHVVVAGLVCRYKVLADGRRQIMAFLIPGDLCDAEIFILKAMDHSVAAMTPSTTALVSSEMMKQMLRGPGCLGEALWWGTMTDVSVLRERIIDHGRRDARERLAHLFYELLVRYRVIGEARDGVFHFPITQTDLADALGLTSVHVNRILKQLRSEGILQFRGKRVSVLDAEGLRSVAGFNANYLHLDRSHDTSDGLEPRTSDLV